MILGHTAPFHYSVLFKYDLIPTIYNIYEATILQNEAVKYGQNLRIHLAVNTGMNRIGFEVSEKSIEEISKIYSYKNLIIDGIFSHFADADNCEDNTYTTYQFNRFRDFTSRLKNAGIEIPVRHLYNSAAIATLEPEFELVREGICMYGLKPSDNMNSIITSLIKPAMSLRSEVIHIHDIESGAAVSYGCKFKASKKMKVATVCAGYADGVPRSASEQGYVLIEGKRSKILGSICMDQFMCDVTEIDNVHIGSVVTIFGKDSAEEITAADVANWAGTISYEVLCGISKRVPRVYLYGGNVQNIHYGIPHEEL